LSFIKLSLPITVQYIICSVLSTQYQWLFYFILFCFVVEDKQEQATCSNVAEVLIALIWCSTVHVLLIMNTFDGITGYHYRCIFILHSTQSNNIMLPSSHLSSKANKDWNHSTNIFGIIYQHLIFIKWSSIKYTCTQCKRIRVY